MQSMIDNLINGNLTDAREQARSKPLNRIVEYLIDDCGWNRARAYTAANYLKHGGQAAFNLYCEAELTTGTK